MSTLKYLITIMEHLKNVDIIVKNDIIFDIDWQGTNNYLNLKTESYKDLLNN